MDRRAVSSAFNNWLNAYAKAINRPTGARAVFQHHFGRLQVTSDRYLAAVVHPIHYNSQAWFRARLSGLALFLYDALLSDKPTRRNRCLDWFDLQALRQFHATQADESLIKRSLVRTMRPTRRSRVGLEQARIAVAEDSGHFKRAGKLA